MPKEEQKGITVKKEADMADWYSQVVIKAELADYSSIRGCLVIRPYGYAIWEKIMEYFNERLKKLGVKNAYFPLFIPESFFEKEKTHAKGFFPEVAWVERKDKNEERLAIRPTSETIMYDSYSRWIRSWRDLPLKINQWCNIVRFEVKDVKPFLRSREFLWQEGHNVFEDEKGASKDALTMISEYKKLAEELLAVPVLTGKKTEHEKFPGAYFTTTIEGFMPDGKALQMGKSHNLGQGFSKAFNIEFLGKDGNKHRPWQTSWGFSTRLIGALVMMHGDDKGLILPPKVAPIQIVIVPILPKEGKEKVLEKAEELKKKLSSKYKVHMDSREEYSPGWKFNEWEMKGVPLRIEIGPKDIANKSVVIARRDNGNKKNIKVKDIETKVGKDLEDIQKSLYKKADKFMKSNVTDAKNWDDFQKAIDKKMMVKSLFCGKVNCEDKIKEKTNGVTARVIESEAKGKCVHCNDDANLKVYFAKSY